MRSEFSRRLRKLRSRKNVSLQVLPDFGGLLAEFFGVTIDYLYGRK